MVEVLNRIHEETHNTMITVTHDKRCAAALCDRAVWIKDGKTYSMGKRKMPLRLRQHGKRHTQRNEHVVYEVAHRQGADVCGRSYLLVGRIG